MVKRIRTLTFSVLCEIAGKIGTYGFAVSPKLGRFGARAEEWAAKRRDRP